MLFQQFFKKLLRRPRDIVRCYDSFERNSIYSRVIVAFEVMIKVLLLEVAKYHHRLRKAGHMIRLKHACVVRMDFTFAVAVKWAFGFRKTHNAAYGLIIIFLFHRVYFDGKRITEHLDLCLLGLVYAE